MPKPKTVPITIRLSESDHERLRRIASNLGLSKAKTAQGLITQHIDSLEDLSKQVANILAYNKH